MPIQGRWLLAAIVTVAFLLRLVSGLSKGPDFVDDGYSFYAEIANTFWSGQGLCYAPGIECAQRMPLYPVLVAPFLASGTAYPFLLFLKAAIGALQPLFAYLLATRLFSARVALVAAAATAVNPYAVVHGPSFQDTVVFNALMAGAVVLLIRSAETRSRVACLAAGLTLALAMLTVVRMLVFVPVALAWVCYAWREEGWRRQVIERRSRRRSDCPVAWRVGRAECAGGRRAGADDRGRDQFVAGQQPRHHARAAQSQHRPRGGESLVRVESARSAATERRIRQSGGA